MVSVKKKTGCVIQLSPEQHTLNLCPDGRLPKAFIASSCNLSTSCFAVQKGRLEFKRSSDLLYLKGCQKPLISAINTEGSHRGVSLVAEPLCLAAVLPGLYDLSTYLIPPSVTLNLAASQSLVLPSAFSLRISSLSCGERRLRAMRCILNTTADT